MSLFKAWSEDKLNKKFVMAENFAELVSKGKRFCLFPKVSDCVIPGAWWVGDLTLFEALKKSNARALPRGVGGNGWGRWAVLELTGT